jgi:plasmid stabilization system protein ParE
MEGEDFTPELRRSAKPTPPGPPLEKGGETQAESLGQKPQAGSLRQKPQAGSLRQNSQAESLGQKPQAGSLRYQDTLPPWALKLALARPDLVRLFRQAARQAPPGPLMAARREFLATYNPGAWPLRFAALGTVSLATAERWARAIRTRGDPLGLVPQWGRHHRGQTSMSPEAGRVLLAMALNPNRLRLKEVVRLSRRVMAPRGIEDGCSDVTYLRFLKDFRDRNFGHGLFHWEGEKARKGWNYAAGIAARLFGLKALEWCSKEERQKVLAGLIYQGRRCG